MSKFLFYLILFLSQFHFAKGQQNENDFPVIGKPCPNFLFTDVQYHSKKQVSLKDFEGKWLVLDFWNRYCGTCLDKMPLMDSMQKAFSANVSFLLIGYTGSQYVKRSDDKAIRKLYEMNRKRLKLNLSIAYDSLIFHQFKILACPYIIVIDPQGIVKAISYKLSENDLIDLIAGKPVDLPKVYRKDEY